MKQIFIYPQVLFFIILGVISGCNADDLKKGFGTASASYDPNEIKFVANFKEGDRLNSVDIVLTHYSDNGFIHQIDIQNILKSEDTTVLTYHTEFPFRIDTFTSDFIILYDLDALAEKYVVDTIGGNMESYVVLENVSSRKVTGSFNINFITSPGFIFPKEDATIPDRFTISDGRFVAEKF